MLLIFILGIIPNFSKMKSLSPIIVDIQIYLSLINIGFNLSDHNSYKMKIVIILLLAIATFCYPQNPVIGIYTQDSDYPGYEQFTYIAASYVKSMEMVGVQVIPLFYHYNREQLTEVLSQINGVLFPGGEMPIDLNNQWTQNTKFILEYAMDQNTKGNVYPIWATCLGEQAIAYITSLESNNMSTLTEVHGQSGATRKLVFKTNNSVLFNDMPAEVMADITTGEGVYYFHHRWAVLLSTYQNSVPLRNYWNLISTSVSPFDEQFVSTLEAKNYPFFLTQYHPQKNSFEWRIPATRTYNAIRAQQIVFNVFSSYARQNQNRFANETQLKERLIYNYQPLFTSPDYDFVQIYLFNETQLVTNVQKKHLFTEQ